MLAHRRLRERGRQVDRRHHPAGREVGILARVDRPRLETVLRFGHEAVTLAQGGLRAARNVSTSWLVRMPTGCPPSRTSTAVQCSSRSTTSDTVSPTPSMGGRGFHHVDHRTVEHLGILERLVHQRQLRQHPRHLFRRERQVGGGGHHELRHTELAHPRERVTRRDIGSDDHELGDRIVLRVEHVARRRAFHPQEAEADHPAVVEDLRQVVATGVGEQHDDHRVGTELAADHERGVHRGAARPADEDALLARHAPRCRERLRVGDHHRAVDRRRVEGGGPEVLAHAFHEIRPPRSAGEHRAFGVGADDLHIRVLRLQVPRDAGDGAAGADAGHEVRDPTRGLPPDLRAGGPFVLRRIRGVRVLVRAERAGRLARQTVGHRVVRVGVVGRHGSGTHDHVGAVRAQQRDLLLAHLVGHHEDAVVAAPCGDDRETHTGVARRGLHDGAAGP